MSFLADIYKPATEYIKILNERWPKMTNAERIRRMTDEELARFIANQRGWYCDYKDPSEEEYPKVLEWLKSPEVDEWLK